MIAPILTVPYSKYLLSLTVVNVLRWYDDRVKLFTLYGKNYRIRVSLGESDLLKYY